MTLSKETMRTCDFPSELAHPFTLGSLPEVLSFSRWIQRHGASIHTLALSTTFTPMSQTLSSYVVGCCPKLVSFSMHVPTFDLATIVFISSKLQDLTLDLSGYLDASVCFEMIEFPSLKSLCIRRGHSKRVTLPPEFPSLEKIHLEHCNLGDMALPRMPVIRSLGLPRCQVDTNTVDSIGDLTTLTKLDLSWNTMTYAPDEISCLVHIEELNLSHNLMTNYREDGGMFGDTLESLESLGMLTHLDLSHNFIDTAGMEALATLLCIRLEYLDISCTPCTMIPRGGYMKSLRHMKASFVPSHLGAMTCLRELQLHSHCDRYRPFDEPWPDIKHVSIPASLETLSIHDDDAMDVRLVRDMLDIVKRMPRIQCIAA